jgi:hypothetical protein
MAQVSDFDVASGSEFLFDGAVLNSTFHAGGRNSNEDVFVQVSGLGGFVSGRSGINIRASVNGTSLGVFTFNIQKSFLTRRSLPFPQISSDRQGPTHFV